MSGSSPTAPTTGEGVGQKSRFRKSWRAPRVLRPRLHTGAAPAAAFSDATLGGRCGSVASRPMIGPAGYEGCDGPNSVRASSRSGLLLTGEGEQLLGDETHRGLNAVLRWVAL